jgi:4-hydroxy-3-polyprenylbenzoate decarboxylase
VLDHATPDVGVGSKMGFDATRKMPGEGFKRQWPPLIRMDDAVLKKVSAMLGGA